MIEILCDICKKKSIGDIYGFDCCGSKICEAKLTIKAHREFGSRPYSSVYPDKKEVKKMKEYLRRRNA